MILCIVVVYHIEYNIDKCTKQSVGGSVSYCIISWNQTMRNAPNTQFCFIYRHNTLNTSLHCSLHKPLLQYCNIWYCGTLLLCIIVYRGVGQSVGGSVSYCIIVYQVGSIVGQAGLELKKNQSWNQTMRNWQMHQTECWRQCIILYHIFELKQWEMHQTECWQQCIILYDILESNNEKRTKHSTLLYL